MKFEKYNLLPELLTNIERQGFKRPTDIQFKAIPPILKGEDVLGVAQTGTGKTVAFALPVIEILLSKKIIKRTKNPRCIVMVPTHELALQVSGVFRELSAHLKFRTLGIIGGADQQPQIEMLNNGVDAVVATPGRLFDLEHQGHLNLNDVEILVIDEADHMLELGFKKDMDQLIKKLPRKRQTLFFSATINKRVKELAYSLVNKPVRIQISPKDPVARNITHSVAFIEMDHKRYFMERIIHENPDAKILVFVRTKVRAERVLKAMERVNINSQTIHSDKTQKERNKVMERFKAGLNKILIATDVSARGVDIPNVDMVINYDLPQEAENYVHRVGRTGRGKQKGVAISFCSSEEKPTLEIIEKFLQKPVKVLEVNDVTYEETIDLSEENPHDWRTLVTNEQEKKTKRKKK